MKRVYPILLLPLLLSGCGYQYERAKARESANTLQQKRDVLLKWTPFTINNRHSGGPSNAYEARRNYIGHGEESVAFLSGLISQCYNSASDLCAYDYYVNAANLENEKYRAEQAKVANDYKKQLIAEKNKKTPAKKDDLFTCKLSISESQMGAKIDSGIRVKVKENINTFTMIMNDGSYIESPVLKEFENGSGLRVGFSDGNMMNAAANYDGEKYQIVINKKVIRRYYHTTLAASAIPFTINDTASYETSLVLKAFDCKKI